MSVLHTTQRIGVAAAGSVTLAREAQRLDSWKEIARILGGLLAACNDGSLKKDCRFTVMNIQGEEAFLLSGRNAMRGGQAGCRSVTLARKKFRHGKILIS